MAKPRVIIADTDEGYISTIQLKFVKEYFDKIELEIITDKEYFDKAGKQISFAVTVSSTQTLNIELDILYPAKEDEPFYKITSWKVENTASLDLDTSLPVIK